MLMTVDITEAAVRYSRSLEGQSEYPYMRGENSDWGWIDADYMR